MSSALIKFSAAHKIFTSQFVVQAILKYYDGNNDTTIFFLKILKPYIVQVKISTCLP